MDRDLWAACSGWVLLALAKSEQRLDPVEEARAIRNGAAAMIKAGAYLSNGRVTFPVST